MQLTHVFTTLVAISASVSAVALPGDGKGKGNGNGNGNGNGGNGNGNGIGSGNGIGGNGDGGAGPTCSNVSTCKQGGLFSFLSPNACQNSGGQAYCCTATGLINIFTCDNLINGNIDILDLFDIIGQK